jgi:molybdopterin converting factor small subunit
MKVCVRLYATLAQSMSGDLSSRHPQEIRAGTPLELQLPDGSTLSDLVARLALPKEKVRVAFVNGKVQRLDFRLSPGDEVGLFPPVGGG